MNSLLRQMVQTIRTRRLFPEPGVAIVAVSGGPDSMALLHALEELKKTLDLDLVVAHLDHGLRGDEATADAALVGETAGRLGIPAAFAYRPVRPGPGESLEETARNVRYAFLGEVADRYRARYIVIGHTADDQAETLLMRLMRGAGPRGLKAMTSLAERTGAAVVRPMLDTPRDVTRDYLNEHGIAFRLDRTNRDLRLARNRTRHVLMPLLASEFNPAIVATLSRTAELMHEVDEYLTRRVEEVFSEVALWPIDRGQAAEPTGRSHPCWPDLPWPRIPGPHADCVVLDIPRLNSYDQVLRRYLMRYAILLLRNDLRGIGFDHVDALVALAAPQGHGRQVDLPGELVGLREGNELSIWSGPPGEAKPIPFTPLPLEGPIDLSEFGLRIESRPVKLAESTADERVSGYSGTGKVAPAVTGVGTAAGVGRGEGESPARAVFNRAELRLPLAIRSRRAGDRILPLGMEADKKVKDILIDLRVPRRLRAHVPILVDGSGEDERVLWVAGCRRSAHALVVANTVETVEVRISALKS